MQHTTSTDLCEECEEVMDNTDDLPCCDPVSPDMVNRWFDFFAELQRRDTSSRGPGRQEMIERLRQCALEGSRRARRTKKKMQALVAKKLREVAEEMERDDE